MNKKTETQETVALEIETLLDFVDELELEADCGNIDYSTRSMSMLKLYLYMLIKGIKGFKTIAKQLKLKPQLLTCLGLEASPHRTTLSRRFKQLPEVLRTQIRSLHADFVDEGLTLVDAMSVDSSLMHAEGNVWRNNGIRENCLSVATLTQKHIGALVAVVNGFRVIAFIVLLVLFLKLLYLVMLRLKPPILKMHMYS